MEKKVIRTEITINATPQTVWSIMDDLERYPEWNTLLPLVEGRTTVGQVLNAKIAYPNLDAFSFSPMLTRIVGGRELRWISVVLGDDGFTADHYFVLRPTADGGTHLENCEAFEGPNLAMVWPLMEAVGHSSFDAMNADLKARAVAAKVAPVSLHPSVDKCVESNAARPIELLRCGCDQKPVEVSVGGQVWHSHLCGCSKCWKPSGALFALIAVVPAGTLKVTANADKLHIVDRNQAIQRHACRECGRHMVGRVEDPNHHFYGIDFIHPELADGTAPTPEFAGFVSSIIETGTDPSKMAAVRTKLATLGIPAYDAFSPELMDIIAWHKVKIARADLV